MATEVNKDILYLVTGAAGFLGGTVCRQLINDGCKVNEPVEFKEFCRMVTEESGGKKRGSMEVLIPFLPRS